MPIRTRVLLDGVRDELLAALDLRIVPATTHEALDGEDGVAGICDGLALGQLPDQPLAGLGEGDDARDGPTALTDAMTVGLAAFHHGDDGVRRAEVDADDLAHGWCVLLARCGIQEMGWSLVKGTGSEAAAATSAGREHTVAQSVTPPDLLDDLALGAARARHVGDRLVLARIEWRAGRGVDLGHALALEELAQLADRWR